MRDLNALQRKATAHGTHVGTYAAAVLEHPLPWTWWVAEARARPTGRRTKPTGSFQQP
jgi:hypothetical protein